MVIFQSFESTSVQLMNELTNYSMNSVILLAPDDTINETVFDYILYNIETDHTGIPSDLLNETVLFIENSKNIGKYDNLNIEITEWAIDCDIKDYLWAINNNVDNIFSDNVVTGYIVIDFIANYILNNDSYLIQHMDWITNSLNSCDTDDGTTYCAGFLLAMYTTSVSILMQI